MVKVVVVWMRLRLRRRWLREARRCLAKAFHRVRSPQISIVHHPTSTSRATTRITPIASKYRLQQLEDRPETKPPPCILICTLRMPWVSPSVHARLAEEVLTHRSHQHAPRSSPPSKNAMPTASCTRPPVAATASRTRSTSASRRSEGSSKLRTEPPRGRSAIASRLSRKSWVSEHVTTHERVDSVYRCSRNMLHGQGV